RSDRRADLHRPPRAAGAGGPARATGPGRARQGRARAPRWPPHRRAGLLLRADRRRRREPFHGADARGELRPRHRHPACRGRRGGGGPHERHALRAHRRRVHPGRRARAPHPLPGEQRFGVLELLRPRQPPPPLVGPRSLRHRLHPGPRGHPRVRAAQGVALALPLLNATSEKRVESDVVADDERTLRNLGYQQELARKMGGFSNYAISMSIICILAGGVTSFHQGLSSVGGAAFGLGWPLVCLFSLALAATMGQVASCFPTAGGLYHWASILGGKGWGWTTAWLNLLGLVAALAAINLGALRFTLDSLGPLFGLAP